ncbi:MAG: hypothetical protein HZA90_14485 [Verrucomicrobia bacterium]|nr:hypothetical protein [Verrucomicrobiota bacterium]
MNARIVVLAIVAGFYGSFTLPLSADVVLRTASGATAASIVQEMEAFRTDLGGVNNGVSTAGGPAFTSGRREINWDASTVPTNLPPDFFNRVSPRGAVFSTSGSGFQVSVNTNAGPDRLFGNVDSSYATEFTTNSPNRLFAPVGATALDVHFFVPGSPATPATVSGFGVVFADVDMFYFSVLDYYDLNGELLGSFIATPADKGVAFLGASFNGGERIFRVRITTGNLALGPGHPDDPDNYVDVVVLDDFIYAEPQAAPVVRTAAGPDAVALAEALAAFRADIGGTNNGVATGGAPALVGGRREINWDAAVLPTNLPPDFFNEQSKRGVVLAALSNQFRVSVNTNAGPTRLFGDVNPDYVSEFTTNSPNRLFAPVATNVLEVHFFVPGSPATPAVVTSFGAVFADVDFEYVSKLELLDFAGKVIAAAYVPPSPSGGLSFVGVTLRNGEHAVRARLTCGTDALSATNLDIPFARDVVALDDFIYSEPLSLQPRLASPPVVNGNTISLSVSALSGLRFAVERSLNLTNWTPLATQSSSGLTLDTNATDSRRFYRARLLP